MISEYHLGIYMLKNNLISIVIPTYEMKGDGLFFLKINLNRILQQTHKNVEVIVSDHSIDNNIEQLCTEFSNKLKIKYFRNELNRGSSSANMNNGINNSSGSIIKILMQDDYLHIPNALENTLKAFNENNINWVVTGCAYGGKDGLVRGDMFPVYTQNILSGNNRIGSPSVLTIKNEEPLLFNKDLIWLMDCDYYKRCYSKFGHPYVINEHHVFISQHEHQLTSLLLEERKNKEIKLIKEIYSL
jgi:glycosyltransferase involved in cell wall biosynthesis